MNETLSERAEELAHIVDLVRTSLSLADTAIPPINDLLTALAEMGMDNMELEGPLVYWRAVGYGPDFDDTRVVYAAALVMPYGLGFTAWGADEHARRYGESSHEPPHLKERFVPYEQCPAIVRAMLPAHAPTLIARFLQSFSVLLP